MDFNISADEGDVGKPFLKMKANRSRGNPDQIIAAAAKQERKDMVAEEIQKMADLEPRIYTDRIAMV